MIRTITVRYSCDLGKLLDAEVEIPARYEQDSVVQWMKDVGVLLSEDHEHRSPGCHPTALKNVMIPVGNARWIGDAGE